MDEGRVSLGYWLIEEFRGQKIIGHVLPALIEWAFKSLEIQRLELYVEPWNIASIKTAQSLGFQKEGLMRSWQKIGAKRKDMLMMSLIITEY
ncbi:MAG: hypothetical protein COB14_08935 [Alphaproteobacteria bacterium]|nr:MAG: hypothetical protein COB14_08935 [Alphaproteobacteria bacterium]